MFSVPPSNFVYLSCLVRLCPCRLSFVVYLGGIQSINQSAESLRFLLLLLYIVSIHVKRMQSALVVHLCLSFESFALLCARPTASVVTLCR